MSNKMRWRKTSVAQQGTGHKNKAWNAYLGSCVLKEQESIDCFGHICGKTSKLIKKINSTGWIFSAFPAKTSQKTLHRCALRGGNIWQVFLFHELWSQMHLEWQPFKIQCVKYAKPRGERTHTASAETWKHVSLSIRSEKEACPFLQGSILRSYSDGWYILPFTVASWGVA